MKIETKRIIILFLCCFFVGGFSTGLLLGEGLRVVQSSSLDEPIVILSWFLLVAVVCYWYWSLVKKQNNNSTPFYYKSLILFLVPLLLSCVIALVKAIYGIIMHKELLYIFTILFFGPVAYFLIPLMLSLFNKYKESNKRNQETASSL